MDLQPRLFVASSMRGMNIAQEFYTHIETSGAEMVLWTDLQFPQGPYVEFLRSKVQSVDGALFVVTSEDLGISTETPVPTYLNLLFEIGLCIGILGTHKVMVITDSPELLPFGLNGAPVVALLPDLSNLHLARQPVNRFLDGLFTTPERRTDDEAKFNCFISYHQSDREFATKLHDSLEQIGIKAWLDHYELNFRDFDFPRLLNRHDKIILIVSRDTLSSQWMQTEILRCEELEAKQGRAIVFPLVLEDSISLHSLPINFASRKYIALRDWHDPRDFQKAFANLVRVLTEATALERRR